MIRKANENDISRVAEIYDKIIDNDKGETSRVGWIKGVYPTAETAGAALEKDELFVLEEDGTVFGAAVINKTQPPAYAKAHWNYTDAADDRIMVLYTLVIDPETKGRGFGTKFVDFYENYAREDGCLYLRIDTNETNSIISVQNQIKQNLISNIILIIIFSILCIGIFFVYLCGFGTS